MSGTDSQQSLYDLPATLAALKRHDRATQEQVFRLERTRLMSMAMRTLGDRSAAEHLVGDVFTDFFFDHVGTLNASRSIPAYLRIMTIRRANRVKLKQSNEDDVTEMDIPSEEGADPTEQVDTRLWLRWLEACVMRLTTKARTMLKLHYAHELPLAEIASHGGVSKQAVGKSIQKCLALLKTCLETKRRESALSG